VLVAVHRKDDLPLLAMVGALPTLKLRNPGCSPACWAQKPATNIKEDEHLLVSTSSLTLIGWTYALKTAVAVTKDNRFVTRAGSSPVPQPGPARARRPACRTVLTTTVMVDGIEEFLDVEISRARSWIFTSSPGHPDNARAGALDGHQFSGSSRWRRRGARSILMPHVPQCSQGWISYSTNHATAFPSPVSTVQQSQA